MWPYRPIRPISAPPASWSRPVQHVVVWPFPGRSVRPARAIARAIRRPVSPDRLTWRLALARERGALLVAEGCLIPLGLFPDRVRRGGPVPAYVGVGRAAYRAAGHLEPAYGFHLMVEALRFLRGPDQSGLLSLARDDSETTTRVLRGHPVLVFSSR